jgi:hypothetical protein
MQVRGFGLIEERGARTGSDSITPDIQGGQEAILGLEQDVLTRIMQLQQWWLILGSAVLYQSADRGIVTNAEQDWSTSGKRTGTGTERVSGI